MKKQSLVLFIGLILVGSFLIYRTQFYSPTKNENVEPTKPEIAATGASEQEAESENLKNQDRKPAQTGSVADPNPLQKYLQSKDPQATWSIQTHPDGRPSHILGGRIRASSLSQLLKEVAPLLGVRAEDLRVQTEGEPVNISNSSQMTQYYGRHRVYGAMLKAFSNPNTEEVYHIVNELRVLQEVDTRVTVNRTEAGEIARKALGDAEINVIKISQEPVVYGTTPTDNQLVWRIFITSERPRYQSREILVGAHTGKIVSNQTMLRH